MAKPKKVARKAVRKVTKAAGRKPARKVVAKKPARKAAPKKPARKVAAKKPVRKVVVKKPVRKAAPKPVRKPVAKVAAKAASKAPARQAARKPAAKAAPATAAATAAGKAIAAGRFCWHDLMVPDVDAALGFYRGLFGWTTQAMDMGPAGTYQMFAAGGVTFAGAAKLPMPGVPPHWLPYVGVADIDAACRTAQAGGGAVIVPPMPIPGVGRFAVLADPTGGALSPIQLDGPPMRDLDQPPAVGMVGWNELVTPDPAKAGPFYAAVFGWKVAAAPMMGGMQYELFMRGEAMEAGLMKTPPGAPADRGAWMVYFNVDDADAMTDRARALGAAVLMAPFDVPEVGRISVVADPQGAVFGLFRPVMS
ncbi:MAG: VOC family protein [Deltaproteobacteria bacterium]|nr:VOC family protein [Deltaproteobacteria bacterium]